MTAMGGFARAEAEALRWEVHDRLEAVATDLSHGADQTVGPVLDQTRELTGVAGKETNLAQHHAGLTPFPRPDDPFKVVHAPSGPVDRSSICRHPTY